MIRLRKSSVPYCETKMKFDKKKKTIILISSTIILIAWLSALKAIYWGALDFKLLFKTSNVISLFFYLLIHFIFFIAWLLPVVYPQQSSRWIGKLSQKQFIPFLLLGMGLFSPIYIFAYSDWGSVFSTMSLRVIFLVADLSTLTFAIYAIRKNKKLLPCLLIALILVGTAFAFSIRFRRIIDYPFSLNWSEGNRFWDYSVLFNSARYDHPAGQEIFALIDFGRQSLWGLIYLLPDITIKTMRLWNDLLYILPSILLGILLFKKKDIPLIFSLLASLWVFLFLDQGPIYTPLILALILTILATELPLLPGLILVGLAGYYAQLTRYTWSVAPAMWAGLLMLLNKNEPAANSPKKLLRSILFITCGLAGGIFAPIFLPVQKGIYKPPSGTTLTIADRIASTLSNQDLIWSRLLPNSTNPTGILISITLATVPTLIFIFLTARGKISRLKKPELGYVILCLLATFIVGATVSVKIGGGSNLHNFDLYFLTIVLLAGIFHRSIFDFFNDFSGKRQESVLMALLVGSIFVFFQHELFNIKPITVPSSAIQAQVLDRMQAEIDARKDEGEILFIDQRQLLTFGYIKAPLVVDYEKKLLMNEALSNDRAYFDAFYSDLKDGRFSLIINEPTNITYQEDEVSYGEENDAYVKWVSEPLLCYYEALETFSQVNVELLIPRVTPAPAYLNCPQEEP